MTSTKIEELKTQVHPLKKQQSYLEITQHEKLTKFIRLKVYSYLPGNDVLFKISKLNSRERKESSDSGLVGK